jgi:uncharacterized protein YigA (DUF484 family)
MTAYVRKAERVLTDDDRRLIRRLWRDKLTLSQKILDIDWQLLDLRDREEELNAEAAKLATPTAEQRKALDKVRKDIQRLAEQRSYHVADMNMLTADRLSEKFEVSKSQIYYVVHAR